MIVLVEIVAVPFLISAMISQAELQPIQSTTDQNSRQIDDMARRLEALEKRNAELQGQARSPPVLALIQILL